MIVTDEITVKVRKLPRPSQEKVLHFVDLLLESDGRADENQEWSDFSFAQAMRGLEDDGIAEYTDADLKERWQ
jgi:protein-disulfide isomerase